jgi:hypothetical protein
LAKGNFYGLIGFYVHVLVRDYSFCKYKCKFGSENKKKCKFKGGTSEIFIFSYFFLGGGPVWALITFSLHNKSTCGLPLKAFSLLVVTLAQIRISNNDGIVKNTIWKIPAHSAVMKVWWFGNLGFLT